jgi:hypothetical protein
MLQNGFDVVKFREYFDVARKGAPLKCSLII